MAQLTFATPDGNECYGCLALNTHSFYCEFFKEHLHNTVVLVAWSVINAKNSESIAVKTVKISDKNKRQF